MRGGKEDQSDQLADLIRFGMDERDAKAMLADSQDDEAQSEYGVWPCNWVVITIFVELRNKWAYFPSGKPAGILPGALQEQLVLMRVKRSEWREISQKVTTCEDTVKGIDVI